MVSRKKPDDSPPPRWLRGIGKVLDFFLGRFRTLVLVALVVGAGLLGARWLWQRVAPDVLSSEDFRVRPENIEMTPPPAWVRADIKTEVLRYSTFDEELTMLDDDLAARVADAFTFHPWVKRVRSVTKSYPGLIKVDIKYREPVAMFEIIDRGEVELVPVDADAVRLPGDNFSPLEKLKYLRLIGSTDAPLVGQQFSDAKLKQAATLAKFLAPHVRDLELAAFRIAEKDWRHVERTDSLLFELVTEREGRIIWGSAPGSEPPGEAAGEEKLARLASYMKQHGTPARGRSPEVIDVRSLPEVPRTARRE